MSSSIKHLLLIIDLNPYYWADKMNNFKQYLNMISQFANAYLAFDINHRLSIIGCSHTDTTFLYPDQEKEAIINPTVTQTNMLEQLFVLDQILQRNIQEFLDNAMPSDAPTGSMITMAVIQGLCHINRLIRETGAGEKNQYRILILQTTTDTSKQYMNFMNAVFTAEKLNIPIDGCILNHESSLLQQACDLTSGLYLRIPDPNGLLQYLLWLYLTDKDVRKMLVVPSKTAVDYRPACFCHHRLIDTGYVCSVCLSIYCDNSSQCSTCRASFETNGNGDATRKSIR